MVLLVVKLLYFHVKYSPAVLIIPQALYDRLAVLGVAHNATVETIAEAYERIAQTW